MVCRQTIAGQWHHAVLAAQLGHRHAAFGLTQDRLSRPIALQSPAGQRMICASVYLLVFIQNLLVHTTEKILLMQPLTFRGDYQTIQNGVEGAPKITVSVVKFGCSHPRWRLCFR